MMFEFSYLSKRIIIRIGSEEPSRSDSIPSLKRVMPRMYVVYKVVSHTRYVETLSRVGKNNTPYY